jgi:hypothetical protein
MKEMKGIPEADAFVRRGIRYVNMSDIRGHYAPLLRCIDGRRGANPERLGVKVDEEKAPKGFISFPGGGIGVAALILSAINTPFIEKWEKAEDPRGQSAREVFSFMRVMDILERSLGGMSCHTDEHAIDEPLACAGCGHAMAFLNGGYGLGDIYRAAMTEYLTELKQRALKGEEEVIIDVYHGKHVESAVVRILSTLSMGQFASIPPTDNEMSVFVFNERMAIDVLSKVTSLVYEEMRSDFKHHGISKEELTAHVLSLFYTHARSSAFKLAHGLPVYDVIHSQPGAVEVRKSDLIY